MFVRYTDLYFLKLNICLLTTYNEIYKLIYKVYTTANKGNYTLNLKSTTSPSFMTYSLPSERTLPFSRAPL